MNFTFHPADFVSLTLFVLFCVFMTIMCLYALRKTQYRERFFAIAFLVYLFLFCLVVQSGIVLEKPIPFVPLLFLSIFAVSFSVALSPLGRRLEEVFSLAALIGFQGFRLPLELILHQWVTTQTIPETMTWTGQNLDILAGGISLLAIPLIKKSRAAAWGAQLIGFVLLLNVLRVVLMSSPFPFSWPLENPLQLVGHLPYALIGPLFVGVAFTLHLLTFRALLKSQNFRSPVK